jgi:3-oxoacyl-[acyl-carrier protein] reductase
MVRQVIQAFGGLDYLVNNLGVPCIKEPIPNRDLDRLTEEFWHAILTTNLIGPFRCANAAAETLRQSRGALARPSSSMAVSRSEAALVFLTDGSSRDLN